MAQPCCPRCPPEPLPKPGELVLLDFRSPEAKAAAAARDPQLPVRLLEWNIERGYKLAEVIEELRRLDADVLALQEVRAAAVCALLPCAGMPTRCTSCCLGGVIQGHAHPRPRPAAAHKRAACACASRAARGQQLHAPQPQIDIHCERSQWEDTGVAIAKALGLQVGQGRARSRVHVHVVPAFTAACSHCCLPELGGEAMPLTPCCVRTWRCLSLEGGHAVRSHHAMAHMCALPHCTQYAFLCEFEELWSPVRDSDAQGGGVHGNAILSKCARPCACCVPRHCARPLRCLAALLLLLLPEAACARRCVGPPLLHVLLPVRRGQAYHCVLLRAGSTCMTSSACSTATTPLTGRRPSTRCASR